MGENTENEIVLQSIKGGENEMHLEAGLGSDVDLSSICPLEIYVHKYIFTSHL